MTIFKKEIFCSIEIHAPNFFYSMMLVWKKCISETSAQICINISSISLNMTKWKEDKLKWNLKKKKKKKLRTPFENMILSIKNKSNQNELQFVEARSESK